MTVPLTASQISELLEIIPLSVSIPEGSARAFRTKTQSDFREHLEKVKLCPAKFKEFKKIIEDSYRKSIIPAGESVGIICAQSIGQMNTQMTLNSFHHAGISEAAMTAGVPKFQELLSATHNPKITNTSIFFACRPTTFDDVVSLCNNIKHLTLKEGVLNWYNTGEFVEFEFNWKVMYRYGVYPLDFKYRIGRAFSDIGVTIRKSSESNTLVLVVTPVNPEGVDGFEYINEIVIPNLLVVTISGIENVKHVFYEKKYSETDNEEDEEWFVRTVGSDYERIILMPGIDFERTVSNNIWDTYELLGIEAARESLRREFSSIMGGINSAHTTILVDRMTYSGEINSISRYTLKNENSSVLGKASFEESLENFLQASLAGSTDSATGNSSSIVLGKKARAGTGFMKLRVDLDMIRLGRSQSLNLYSS